jgi:hypothetical protein
MSCVYLRVSYHNMTLHHFNEQLKIQEDAFVWRYMNFDKLWDFISNNCIYFSRLDTFHDPIEGLPIEYRGNLQTLHILESEVPNDDFPKLNRSTNRVSKTDIEKWQKATYCSCWYLTETVKDLNAPTNHHESVAMWNFLTNGDGFIVKIKFNKFLDLLSTALLNFIDKEIFDVKYGKVHYLNYGEYLAMLNSSTNDFMPSLIKHNSFKFENEIRFLLLRDKLVDTNNDRKGIKVKFVENFDSKKHEMEIIAHPNMLPDNFKINSSKLLQFGFNLKVSTILTKDSVERLFR